MCLDELFISRFHIENDFFITNQPEFYRRQQNIIRQQELAYKKGKNRQIFYAEICFLFTLYFIFSCVAELVLGSTHGPHMFRPRRPSWLQPQSTELTRGPPELVQHFRSHRRESAACPKFESLAYPSGVGWRVISSLK
jgi:hypothetical protein